MKRGYRTVKKKRPLNKRSALVRSAKLTKRRINSKRRALTALRSRHSGRAGKKRRLRIIKRAARFAPAQAKAAYRRDKKTGRI